MNSKEKVEAYIPIAKFISAINGPNCEVALHYLDDVEHSIIFIQNGYITGRKLGDGLTDFALKNTLTDENREQGYCINLSGKSAGNSTNLRFSGFFIFDDDKRIIGMLNVTFDLTDYVVLKKIAEKGLCLLSQNNCSNSHETSSNDLAVSAAEMVNSLIRQTIAKAGCISAKMLNKEEKMKILSELKSNNVFSIKGMIKITAKGLCVSEPTLYRYLQELNEN